MSEAIILHLVGDYIIQSGWMAAHKKKAGMTGLLACATHCLTYSLPFLLICSPLQASLIGVGHFVVDRTRIVDRLIALRERSSYSVNFGFPESVPFVVSFWLYVITDNTIHLAFNHAVMTLCP